MSSSVSGGLARSRSLRRPGAGAGADLPPKTDAAEPPRAVSPSRLPVKPPSSSRTAAAAGPGRSAPGILGRSASVKRPAAPTAGADTSRGAAPQPPQQQPHPPPLRRPTQSSGSTLSRPTTSGGPSTAGKPPPSRPAAHTRTKSSATALSNAPVLRPPSQSSTASSATSASNTTAASIRAGVPGAGKALHRRAPSQPAPRSVAPAESRPRPPSSAGTTTSTAQAAPPSAAAAVAARPAFNTHQQHFSPLKSAAPKPLTATYLAPPSPSKQPANVALSAETARLQSRLLQLHLLHRAAAPTITAWHASARAALGTRFAALAADAAALEAAERAACSAANAAALAAWPGGDPDPDALGARLRALDALLAAVWALGDPAAGRHARLVRRFERWLARAGEVLAARAAGDGDGDGLFLPEVDAAFTEERAGVARKLRAWRDQLDELGGVPGAEGGESSSLARILEGCRALVADMLAELEAMEHIENEALAQEARWIRSMIADEEDGRPDAPKAGAVWRVL